MNVREELYRLFCLPKCVSCTKPLSRGENVLCEECTKLFLDETVRDCSFCFQKINQCTCTPKPFKNARIKLLFKISRYSLTTDKSPTKSLIFSLKHDNYTTVINYISALLADRLKKHFGDGARDLILIPIPRRRKNVIKYGYDHAKVLSKRISKLLGCRALFLLKSLARAEQKGLTREERKENARFKLRRKASLEGKCVVLIDDVVTSGASMIGAAQAIAELKPDKTVGACLAISYRDIDLNQNLPF